MYTAKDGKNFGNQEMGRHYDSTRGGKEKGSGVKSEKASSGGDKGGSTSESNAGDGSMPDVIAEHGKATKTEIHDTGDGHEVHSHHEDGHKHVSKGHDVHSAHEHSMHAMTGEGGMEESHEEPDGDEGAEASVAIPGMR